MTYVYLRQRMKKNIAYYLEDPSRLSEISMNELNDWVAEMPYSQSLRLLVDMKKDDFESVGESIGTYGAYFAEDYEPLSKKAIKKLAKKEIEKNKTDKVLATEDLNSSELESEVESLEEESLGAVADIDMPAEATSFIDDDPVIAPNSEGVENPMSQEAEEIVKLDQAAEELLLSNSKMSEEGDKVEEVEPTEASISPLTHSLADDLQEEIIEDDLLETNPNVVLVNEVSHAAADEILEDEVERELLEVVLDDVEEVSSFTELDEQDEVQIIDEVKITEEIVEETHHEGLVDYKVYVKGLNDTGAEVNEIEIKEEEVQGESITEEVVVKEIKKKKQKSKKDKVENKKSKKKKSKKQKPKLEKNVDLDSKGKKIDKKSKEDRPKKSKSKKTVKNKIKKVKNLKGDLSLKAPKSKSVEGKAKKIKKEVKYVVVNEATSNDFKMKDFKGVSNYANWLLEQKSINGNHNPKSKEKVEALAEKKKKSKKKGKKKKSKVLKVAQDSIKKSQMIISEPLANILAAQGHIKKAKKMYTQLGLIFPEKSSYFASKIENLKKK